MDSAEQLSFEIKIFARVPDMGDGIDREGTSTESEQGSGNGSSLPSSLSTGTTISNPPSSTRIRHREQGPGGLLQLKIHQALASIDGPPPPGSTIILATGDGNAGQFNEDGFLGSVRTVLNKGWRVELYAWEGDMSRSWKREFGGASEWGTTLEGEFGPRFKVIGMEQFGSELVENY